jgi:meiotically up-regulated gene 157 (Mug157) protein
MSEEEIKAENERLRKRIKTSQEDKKYYRMHGFFRQRPEEVNKDQRMKYIELRSQEGKWNVAALCRVLQVSESGYYKYLRNKSKPYKYADLLKQIYNLLKEDPENANYGVKRIYQYLRNNRDYKREL